jgi:hypothetical protein
MIAYGLAVSIFEIKPFWLDEWNIIYNLKTKTHAELWGPLDYMQQFPRVYLQVIKYITASFDYGYTAMRLPSMVIHTAGLFLCYVLSGRLFNNDNPYRFFLPLIYASYSTSIEYFVQIKQYTMEMLLALVAIWQLLELLRMQAGSIQPLRYLLLCLLFLVIPFFSYTYPICFIAVSLCTLLNTRTQKDFFYRIMPLLVGSISILVFYTKDVSQVMVDEGMQKFWKDYIMQGEFKPSAYLYYIYKLFANLGTGDFFEVIYGALGLVGFLYSLYHCFTQQKPVSEFQHIVQYSTSLVLIMILLFSFHKLPLGAHRLNAFAVPACGTLVIHALSALEYKWKTIPIIYAILSLTLAGNIFQAFAKAHWSDEAVKKQSIYNNTKEAIILAENRHISIATGTGVAYPYEDRNGDFIVISYPVYHMSIALHVYNTANTYYLKKLFEEHPQLKQVVFIDRTDYSIVSRQQALSIK